MKIILQKAPQKDLSTLVVFFTKDTKSGKPTSGKISRELQQLMESAAADASFSGDKKETVFFRSCNVDGYKHVLLAGLGDAKSVDLESLRVAGAGILAALKGAKVTSAGLNGESLFKAVKDSASAVQAISEGIGLSAYDFTVYKTKKEGANKADKKEKPKPKLEQISLLLPAAPNANQQKALKRAEVLVECQNFARWLGDQPGNYLTPTQLAEETVKAAKGTGLKVTVWNKARIEKEKFGGLLSVARGSAEEPRFIIMEYKGPGAGKKPVCFVGKGLTFDSGGISIKPSQSMEEMKYDMCGGAAVIATMLALAKLKAKVNVIGLVPSTENMPGGRAVKPGDIYYARNGKTVEVFNTDAEGRLILGDALAYGSEQEPAVIFDTATLTGAILVALGNTHTGVFTRDKKLRQRIQEAADKSGELVWAMPLTDFHVEDMKGTHADLCNISSGRLAGSSTAAAFLEEFVGPGIPWAHFDIAGTAWNVASRFPYCPKKGASGIIVRTFVELAESY
jgi:leucyl aminopeptidase